MDKVTETAPLAQSLGQIRMELMSGTEELFNAFFETVAEQVQFTPEQNDKLAEFLGGAMEKRDKLAEFIHRLQSEAGFLRTREKLLADRRHAIEGLAKMFESSIQVTMETKGIKSITGLESRFLLKRNPPKVEITNEEEIPAAYINYPPTIDRRGIADALAEGKEVPGARIADPTNHLEVK